MIIHDPCAARRKSLTKTMTTMTDANESEKNSRTTSAIPLIIGIAVVCIGAGPFAKRLAHRWDEHKTLSMQQVHEQLVQTQAPVQTEILQSMTELPESQKSELARRLTLDLQNAEPMVRRNVSTALGVLGPVASVAAPALDQLVLKDPDLRVRRAANAALSRLGISHISIAAVNKGLRNAEPTAQLSAIEAASRMGTAGGSVVTSLTQLLSSSNRSTQMKTALALGKMGSAAAPATSALSRIVEHPSKDAASADLRLAAVQALGAIGEPAASAVPSLLQALKDPSPMVRGAAASALQSIGKSNHRVLSALLKLEDDEEPTVRLRVLTAVAKLDPGSVETSALLRRHAQDPNLEVARQAEFLNRIKVGKKRG